MTEAIVTVNENFAMTGYTENVMGCAVTIKNAQAVKVGYLVNGSYVEIDADKIADDTYNYAVPKGVTEVVVVLNGDANGDGTATGADLAALNADILGKKDLTDAAGILAADVNGDGRITAADMARLKAIILGKTKGW